MSHIEFYIRRKGSGVKGTKINNRENLKSTFKQNQRRQK